MASGSLLPEGSNNCSPAERAFSPDTTTFQNATHALAEPELHKTDDNLEDVDIEEGDDCPEVALPHGGSLLDWAHFQTM